MNRGHFDRGWRQGAIEGGAIVLIIVVAVAGLALWRGW